MPERKRIMVTPVMAVGHMQACIGLSLPLLKRGHNVAFFIDNTFKGQLSELGFQEILFQFDDDNQQQQKVTKKPGEDLAILLKEHKILGELDVFKQFEKMMHLFYKVDEMVNSLGKMAMALKKAINDYKPDFFIVDSSILFPSIYETGKPWIHVCSCVPNFYLSERKDLPPGCSGFSINNLDEKKCEPFRKIFHETRHEKKICDLFEKLGFKRYTNDNTRPETMSLNVYAFPEEYNYPPIKQLDKWFNVDVFNKRPIEKATLHEIVPADFINDTLNGNFSGKWIYLSMGSMGGADLDLMNRLINALSKTNHKYIVSKGPKHDDIKLAANMWGDRFLPQTQILSFVDLVITHGGNNSVTETFAQGKPMLILPLFADQHDNAQRLHETGFAKKLHPYKFTENELIDNVNDMLYDDILKQKLLTASKRIQNDDKHSKLCDFIDNILSTN